MKLRVILSLASLAVFSASSAHASAWGQRNSYPSTGDTLSMATVTLSSSAASALSAYSPSRSLLTCVNSSNLEVYVGTSTAVTPAGAASYEVGPSTSTYNTFQTTSQAAIYGIAKAGTALQPAFALKVYCYEER